LTILQIITKFEAKFEENVNDALKIAVFASGRGSNFEAILKAIGRGEIKGASIAVVISNNSGSGALEIARNHGIPALHISRAQFDSDGAFDRKVIGTLDMYGVNFIALAGYMKMVSPAVIAKYRNRIINIHPALLPEFGGKGMYGERVHAAVIASGAKESGATVHMVDEVYDRGAIILQKRVAVSPDDTAESLAKKVLEIEHEIYPEAIRMFADGNILIKENKVITA
jgi:phosphoribosylglycinamide formyltransferase-1